MKKKKKNLQTKINTRENVTKLGDKCDKQLARHCFILLYRAEISV